MGKNGGGGGDGGGGEAGGDGGGEGGSVTVASCPAAPIEALTVVLVKGRKSSAETVAAQSAGSSNSSNWTGTLRGDHMVCDRREHQLEL